MSGRGSIKHFHKLMEKKPEIKNVYSNISNFTIDQIESSPFPKWVRAYLLKEKERVSRIEAGFLEPSIIADMMSAAHVCAEIGTWVVHKLSSNLTIGARFPVEASEGDLVAFDADGVIVNGIKKTVSEENALRILNNSYLMGDYTPEEYRQLVREYLNEKY